MSLCQVLLLIIFALGCVVLWLLFRYKAVALASSPAPVSPPPPSDHRKIFGTEYLGLNKSHRREILKPHDYQSSKIPKESIRPIVEEFTGYFAVFLHFPIQSLNGFYEAPMVLVWFQNSVGGIDNTTRNRIMTAAREVVIARRKDAFWRAELAPQDREEHLEHYHKYRLYLLIGKLVEVYRKDEGKWDLYCTGIFGCSFEAEISWVKKGRRRIALSLKKSDLRKGLWRFAELRKGANQTDRSLEKGSMVLTDDTNSNAETEFEDLSSEEDFEHKV